jgi:hypothetical protein
MVFHAELTHDSTRESTDDVDEVRKLAAEKQKTKKENKKDFHRIQW